MTVTPDEEVDSLGLLGTPLLGEESVVGTVGADTAAPGLLTAAAPLVCLKKKKRERETRYAEG